MIVITYLPRLLSGFRTYYGMVVKMAADLGLQDPHNIDMYPSSGDYERNRRRSTYNGLIQLHMRATTRMLVPVALRDCLTHAFISSSPIDNYSSPQHESSSSALLNYRCFHALILSRIIAIIILHPHTINLSYMSPVDISGQFWQLPSRVPPPYIAWLIY